MQKSDKIKNGIAIVLLAAITVSFVALGKDHGVTRSLAASGIIIWLLTIFLINYLKKRN